MTYAYKGKNTLPCARRSEVSLRNCLGAISDGEFVYKRLLTIYFENGNVNHRMSIE